MSKKVIVCGGDGFCGWPTSLRLANEGHEVMIIDNLLRRKIDKELGTNSVTPIFSLEERIKCWNEITNSEIKFKIIDIATDYETLLDTIAEFTPDTIIHFAEQRAAPYSMKSSFHKRLTVNNNINATNNILNAIVESNQDVHLIHLGTMGVYGYGTIQAKIPEGYLEVLVKNNEGKYVIEKEILYPADPGSVYHMTKTQDQLMFYFYNKNDGIRITDLHQGVVWGIQTKETQMHDKLINRFDYDGDFGTVINRFALQAALNYPLTVNGTGGQTRAFININNTVDCVLIALNNPPSKSDKVKIYNQMTECFKIKNLAELISKETGVKIDYLDNPRNEIEENELSVDNTGLTKLGLEEFTLDTTLIKEISLISEKFIERIDLNKIPCKSFWKKQ